MADWKKVEQALDEQALDATEETAAKEKKADKAEKPETAPKPTAEEKAMLKAEKAAEKEKKKKEKLVAYGKKLKEREKERKARVSKYGYRRGRYKWAAPVGFIMSILAVIGVVAVVSTTFGFARDLMDDSELREEIHYFLQPLTTYSPVPEFESVNEEDHDELLRAAVWRITEAERIRMLREKVDTTIYDLDNNGRLIVPITEVEASYQYLFGEQAVLNHRTLGEDDVEYSKNNNCYYIPFNFISSLHQPVIDTIRKNGNDYHVRVAYVSINDLEVDEHGNTIEPTADKAAFNQIFVLRRANDHFIVVSVGSEPT